MKKIMFVLFTLMTSTCMTSVTYVPLTIKPGLWEYKNPASKLLEETLSNVPEQFRSLIKNQMKHLKPIRACISSEDIKDPNHYIHKIKANHCSVNLSKSTSILFDGNLTCNKSNQETSIDFTLDVMSNKEVIIESNIDTSDFSDGGVTKISSKAIWKSDACPSSLKR
jgi:hypothetical protein